MKAPQLKVLRATTTSATVAQVGSGAQRSFSCPYNKEPNHKNLRIRTSINIYPGTLGKHCAKRMRQLAIKAIEEKRAKI